MLKKQPKQNQPSAEDLFAQAVALPAHQRESFIAQRCRDDASIEKELRWLLQSHDKNEADPFILDRPLPLTPFPPASSTEAQAFAKIAEKAGDTIGRYKLLEKIGEGGMGVVYMAEQIEDVRRRVALKIIKLGMDTRRVIARFEAERQAMAMFDHPSITKVFDAGATSTGRPFFVMELVRGTDIVEYAESNQLDLKQKMKLFLQVCGAVQHAHQKGIIHRDLKPSNILVTMHDGDPIAKVIDFGIAKAIGQGRLTEKTLFTPYSAMVGTPQYMSPEQAELNGLDVDTRSDIYSMGVLLYQLITGSPPISDAQLKEVNPLALHETLRDAKIETPSMRILRSTRTQLAKQTPPASNNIDELDWVVMKALSRNRTQRYASAHELAAEVKRFLNNENVLAAPPSKLRKARAYVRRHRSSLTFAAIIGAMLLVSSVASLLFGLNAYRANSKLAKTNRELSDSVQKLEIAETRIRDSAIAQQYTSAISIALMKFENELDYEVFELNRNVLLPLGEEPPTDFGCSIDYDLSELLQIPNADLHVESMQRIRRHLATEQTIIDRVYEANQNDSKWIQYSLDRRKLFNLNRKQPPKSTNTKTAELVCPGDQRLRLIVGDLVTDNRHRFYQYLVEQYRQVFGESDPRVAEALCMLASELTSAERYPQAESHLREAIAIGSPVCRTNATKLLSQIRNR